MFTSTHSEYGVNEVLLASVLGAFVFSILAAQPLVIVGVTGRMPPVAPSVSTSLELTPCQDPSPSSTSKSLQSLRGGESTYMDSTVYDIMKPTGTNYMAFMCWIGM